MPRSSFVTVSIARFDELTASESAWAVSAAGAEPLMWAIGADELAAGVDFGSRQAYSWIALGLHATSESADAAYAADNDAAPFSPALPRRGVPSSNRMPTTASSIGSTGMNRVSCSKSGQSQRVQNRSW